jgi:prepilin-type N-terminal cleavage/methylation domain-containing protein
LELSDRAMIRSKQGYTLIEVILGLALTAIIGGIIFSLVQVGTNVQRDAWRNADIATTRRNVQSVIAAELARSARGAVSAPNFGPIHVLTSGSGPSARDELIISSATGLALRVASRPCRSAAANCFVLIGDHRAEIEQHALLAVGAALSGYRILQVNGAPAAFTALCGLDCPAQPVCSVATVAVSPQTFVAGAVLPDGTTAGSCAESYYPDGTQCIETRASRPLPSGVRATCTTSTTNIIFTEITFADRTAAVGYPSIASWSRVSAGPALPVAAVPIEVTRFRIAADATGQTALVRERGLTSTGAWNAPTRVAGPVTALEVETIHAGESSFERGTGVTAAMMTVTGNPNRIEHLTAPGAGTVGYQYRKGYHTIVGVRLRIDADGIGPSKTTVTESVRIVQSLTGAAFGGTRPST